MGQVTITITGDEARALASLERTKAKLREVGDAGKEAGESSAQSFTRVENAFGRAFGVGAIGSLGAWGVAIAGIKAGLEGVAEVYKDIEKAQEAAAKNTIDRGNAVGKLGQYAAGDKNVATMFSRAQSQIARESGMSEEDSAKLVAEMAEGGYRGGNEAAVTRAWRLKNLGVEHAGKASMTLSHLGGGALGEAASLSNATRPGEVGELIEGTGELRQLAGEMGIPEDELMASIASAGAGAGSTKTGAAQIKALMGGLKAHHFKGSLGDAVKKFGGIKTSDEHLEKLVGGKEGLAGLRALQKESGEQLFNRAGGMSDDAFLGVMDDDEDVQAARSKARSDAAMRDAMKDNARVKSRADAERVRLHAEDIKDNGGEEGTMSWLADWNRRNTPDWRLDPGKDKSQEHLKEIASNTKQQPNTLFPLGDQ